MLAEPGVICEWVRPEVSQALRPVSGRLVGAEEAAGRMPEQVEYLPIVKAQPASEPSKYE